MDTKKLRQKILDLAIRGKLVPQDPNDEPASVLLERIRTEKERLIKEGKIKRGKKSVSDTPHYENEVPFKVPQGWEWCRLSEIANYGGGKTPSMDNKQYWSNGTNLWITSKDMKSERITDSMMKISNEALDIMTQYEPGTLLMVTRSGILRHSLPIAILEEMATVNQDLKTISLYLKGIHEYVYYAIKAREHYILKEYHKDGTTVDSINFEKFAEIPLPIPPYNEQKRIVTAIKHWLSFIEELEKEAHDLESSIQQTKSKILDLAIHGQLVPQDPNDEPATELLKRINPSFVPCDNAQYPNIPSNWVTCTVKDVFLINPKTNASDNLDAGFVPMSSICDQYNNAFTFETRTWSDIKRGYTHFKDGDIAVAKISPCLENRKSVVFHDLPNGIGSGTTELNVFRSDVVYPLFGLYFFKSQHFISNCVGTFNGVVGQQRVATKIVEEIDYFLPPYQEQIRIVGKIEELFAVLDEIQESIEA